MPESARTLFVDTNYLLHYPPLREIDWRKVAGCSEVLLVICMQVVHELDDKKNDPRLGERAGRAIREIESVLEGGGILAEGVSLTAFNSDIPPASFPSGLSADSKDDRILAEVLLYAQSNPDRRIAVLSEDLGMSLKCRPRGLERIKPDTDRRLPDPADEATKKHRQVVEELNRLKNRLPDLRMRIAHRDGEPAEHIEVPANEPPAPLSLEDLLRKADEEFPVLDRTYWPGIPYQVGRPVEIPSEAEYQRYARERTAYREGLASYLAKLNEYRDRNARAFLIKLVLENRGSAPADDTDVHIQFPDYVGYRGAPVLIRPGEDGLKRPDGPTRPVKPRTDTEIARAMMPDYAASLASLPSFDVPIRNVSFVTSSRRVPLRHQYHVRRLKHFEIEVITTCLVVFSSWDAVRSFGIQYELAPSNRHDRQSGEVHVVIQRPQRNT